MSFNKTKTRDRVISQSSTTHFGYSKREWRYLKLQFVIWFTFALGVIATIFFLIGSISDSWAVLIPPKPHFVGNGKLLLEWRRCLWKECLFVYDNSTAIIKKLWICSSREFFPSQETIDRDNEKDNYIIDYERSMAAFSLLTLCLSLLPLFFTWYSTTEPRYIFKRLSGGLFLITAGCGVVCAEVFKHFLEYGKWNLPHSGMQILEYKRGWSYYLSVVAIGLYVFCGIVMFAISGKKKGRYARSIKEAVENEPVIIGRL